MESTRRIVKRALHTQDWIIGLCVAILIAAWSSLGGFSELERAAYEWLVRVSSNHSISEDVVVLAIDEPTLEKLGPWPFSRQTIAKATQLITQGRPKSIGYTFPFSHSESKITLDILSTLLRTRRKDLGKEGTMLVKEAQQLLDTDNNLARSFKKAGNVILAMPYKASQGTDHEPVGLSESLAQFTLETTPKDGGMIEALASSVHKWISESANDSVIVLTPPSINSPASQQGSGWGLTRPPQTDRMPSTLSHWLCLSGSIICHRFPY